MRLECAPVISLFCSLDFKVFLKGGDGDGGVGGTDGSFNEHKGEIRRLSELYM